MDYQKCQYSACHGGAGDCCNLCKKHCFCSESKKEIAANDKFDFLFNKIVTMEKEIEKLKTVQVKLLDKFDQQIIQNGAN